MDALHHSLRATIGEIERGMDGADIAVAADPKHNLRVAGLGCQIVAFWGLFRKMPDKRTMSKSWQIFKKV